MWLQSKLQTERFSFGTLFTGRYRRNEAIIMIEKQDHYTKLLDILINRMLDYDEPELYIFLAMKILWPIRSNCKFMMSYHFLLILF